MQIEQLHLKIVASVGSSTEGRFWFYLSFVAFGLETTKPTQKKTHGKNGCSSRSIILPNMFVFFGFRREGVWLFWFWKPT